MSTALKKVDGGLTTIGIHAEAPMTMEQLREENARLKEKIREYDTDIKMVSQVLSDVGTTLGFNKQMKGRQIAYVLGKNVPMILEIFTSGKLPKKLMRMQDAFPVIDKYTPKDAAK